MSSKRLAKLTKNKKPQEEQAPPLYSGSGPPPYSDSGARYFLYHSYGGWTGKIGVDGGTYGSLEFGKAWVLSFDGPRDKYILRAMEHMDNSKHYTLTLWAIWNYDPYTRKFVCDHTDYKKVLGLQEETVGLDEGGTTDIHTASKEQLREELSRLRQGILLRDSHRYVTDVGLYDKSEMIAHCAFCDREQGQECRKHCPTKTHPAHNEK